MLKKPENELKKIMIAVRMTESEWAQLEAQSEAAGMKPGRLLVSTICRLEIVPPVPSLNRKLYGALGHAQANLNVITARLNRENKLSAGDLLANLRDLSQQLAATRKQLIGAKS